MSKLIFGYWRSMRGYGQQSRTLLRYLKVDHEEKLYNIGSGPEYKQDSWLADKPKLGLDFPNMPYWIDNENKIKLTESKSIIRYIAKTRGNGVLYPKTPELQALADSVEGVTNDIQSALVALSYGRQRDPEIPLADSTADKFTLLENFLSKRKWSIGDNLSFVDFFVYEVLKQYQKYNGDFLKPYPTLLKYIEKFEALPELTEYLQSIDKLPCFSPWALQF